MPEKDWVCDLHRALPSGFVSASSQRPCVQKPVAPILLHKPVPPPESQSPQRHLLRHHRKNIKIPCDDVGRSKMTRPISPLPFLRMIACGRNRRGNVIRA